MNSGIIECVSGDYFIFVITIAVAEAGSIVVHPWNGTAVFFHLTDVADIFQIRYAVVQII